MKLTKPQLNTLRSVSHNPNGSGLYSMNPTVKRLVVKRAIEPTGHPPKYTPHGEEVRFYRITEEGKAALRKGS